MMGAHHAACGAAAGVALTTQIHVDLTMFADKAPFLPSSLDLGMGMGMLQVSPFAVVTGALVTAGAAILPDADHHHVTIAHSRFRVVTCLRIGGNTLKRSPHQFGCVELPSRRIVRVPNEIEHGRLADACRVGLAYRRSQGDDFFICDAVHNRRIGARPGHELFVGGLFYGCRMCGGSRRSATQVDADRDRDSANHCHQGH